MLAKSEGAQHVIEGRITEVERLALITLRDRLRDGSIPHVRTWYDLIAPHGLSLAMNRWHAPHECGTVGCIAGLCYELSGHRAFGRIVTGHLHPIDDVELCRLFAPLHQEVRTAADAADAIDTFLNEGRARWAETSK